MSPGKKEDIDNAILLMPFLYESARKKGVPRQDVYDVIAEVLLDILLRVQPLPSAPGIRKRVILAILRGRIRDYVKRRARRGARETLVEGPVIEELAVAPLDAATAMEERQRIEMVWPRLRAEFQETLSAKAIGETAEETAARLRVNLSTVEAWLSRGRAAAKAELSFVDAFRRPRRLGTVLLLVGISSLLASVRVANAFFEFMRGCFRLGARALGAALRASPSVAVTAGVLAFLQNDPNVGAKEPARAEAHAEQRGNVDVPAARASACGPASTAAPRPKQSRVPAERRKPAARVLSDALLIKAKAALRRGDAPAALAFLDADEAARPGSDEDRAILRAATMKALAANTTR